LPCRTCRSKVGFKDTAAFKATAKKLAPVKAAVMRAARVTVTVVASALHSIAGFAGRSPPATRAASGLSVQASRDVLTRGRSL
jgi:hypothetical protein